MVKNNTENLELVLGALDGKIYLTKITPEGEMDDNKREVTQEVLRVVHEYHLDNDFKGSMVISDDGVTSWLYHTTDEEVSTKISNLVRDKDEVHE